MQQDQEVTELTITIRKGKKRGYSLWVHDQRDIAVMEFETGCTTLPEGIAAVATLGMERFKELPLAMPYAPMPPQQQQPPRMPPQHHQQQDHHETGEPFEPPSFMHEQPQDRGLLNRIAEVMPSSRGNGAHAIMFCLMAGVLLLRGAVGV